MGTWDDSDITESSGLAYSRKWASLVYTMNDEPGPIFAVNTSTGATVGRRDIDGSLSDPESLDIDLNGVLRLFDIGDNDATRDWVNMYVHGEPGPGYGDLNWRKFKIKYPGGTSHNAETGVSWPNGKIDIVTKEATGKVMRLPKTLDSGGFNTCTQVKSSSDLNFVSDAVTQKDGRWAFALKQGELDTVFIFDDHWDQVDTISMPSMVKPEGIAITPGGQYLFVCDDNGGPGGHYQRVTIPAGYRPVPKAAKPPVPNEPPANPCSA